MGPLGPRIDGTWHSPVRFSLMAKKRAAKRSAAKRSSPEVVVRLANPRGSGTMAKKKRSGGKKRSGAKRRSNPSNPRKGSHRRRRRNPPNDFLSRVGRLAGGAAVAVGTAVGVTYATSKIMPGSNVSLYGIPALAFLAGAAMSKSMPILGTGVALGAPAPFALPLATKLLALTPATSTTTSTTTASTTQPATATTNGIGRAYRRMRAVDMGAVDMNMGAVYAPVY